MRWLSMRLWALETRSRAFFPGCLHHWRMCPRIGDRMPLSFLIGHSAGWPERNGESAASCQSYAAAGTLACVGREFAETHVRACLHAGLRVSGTSRPLAGIPLRAAKGPSNYNVSEYGIMLQAS